MSKIVCLNHDSLHRLIDTSELLTYDPTIRPKRGGLCIHRPSSPTPSHDQFLTFSRNLQLQTPRDATHNIERADFLWENALQKNTFRIMEKVSKEKKRGKKRKLVEKGDSSISDVSVATGNSANFSMDTDNKQDGMEVDATGEDGDANGNGTCEIALGTEDDYRMLEYLQLKGSGQVARAQFLSLVELCRGTGMYLLYSLRHIFIGDMVFWTDSNEHVCCELFSCSCQDKATSS